MHIVTEPMPFYLFIYLFILKDQLHPFTVSVRFRTIRMKTNPFHDFFWHF